MIDHSSAYPCNRHDLVFLIAFAPRGEGFNICTHRLLICCQSCKCQPHKANSSLAVHLPSWRKFISLSNALKSSDSVVFTSPPMRSPAHCLKRPSFLFTFIAPLLESRQSEVTEIFKCLLGTSGLSIHSRRWVLYRSLHQMTHRMRAGQQKIRRVSRDKDRHEKSTGEDAENGGKPGGFECWRGCFMPLSAKPKDRFPGLCLGSFRCCVLGLSGAKKDSFVVSRDFLLSHHVCPPSFTTHMYLCPPTPILFSSLLILDHHIEYMDVVGVKDRRYTTYLPIRNVVPLLSTNYGANAATRNLVDFLAPGDWLPHHQTNLSQPMN